MIKTTTRNNNKKSNEMEDKVAEKLDMKSKETPDNKCCFCKTRKKPITYTYFLEKHGDYDCRICPTCGISSTTRSSIENEEKSKEIDWQISCLCESSQKIISYKFSTINHGEYACGICTGCGRTSTQKIDVP